MASKSRVAEEDIAFGDIVLDGSMWIPADRIDMSVTAEEIVDNVDRPEHLGGGRGPLKLPKTHVAGIKVPKGGSCCANCRFVSADGKECANVFWVEWNGGDTKLPEPADEYCSDWWEGVKDAV